MVQWRYGLFPMLYIRFKNGSIFPTLERRQSSMKVYAPFLVRPEIRHRSGCSEQSDFDQLEKSFRAWLDNPRKLQFYPPKMYFIAGIVTQHSVHPDGSQIGTSDIMVLEKVPNGNEPPELLCAITKTGSRYFFRADTLGFKSF